ncbi:MAG: hypothetical protein ABSG93_16725, partial [Solirubrobacteraceae bacterium]
HNQRRALRERVGRVGAARPGAERRGAQEDERQPPTGPAQSSASSLAGASTPIAYPRPLFS